MGQAARYKKAILAIAGGVISIAAMRGIDLGLTAEETAAAAGALATVLSGLLVIFGPKNAE